ncbi:MAG TPA: chromosomal replication initiator protein DnaA [Ruminococcaceae bacterium]|nr:chromosomal replication initiator protein DnaA [Oscillospiraceae bacterium]
MQSFQEVWEEVCLFCKEKISDVAFKTWIYCMEPVELDAHEAVFFVRSDFQRKIIYDRYQKLLTDGFESILGFPIEIRIVTEDDKPKNYHPQTETMTKSEEDAEKPFTGADYEYTFETFIVGSSNKFAHAASLAVAANPATAYNPLFIYGDSGLGKTHLLHAIRHQILKDNASLKILYIKGEDFTNELVESIGKNSQISFRNKYRQTDVLLVDDIQFIAGKESTQEEFFHTFNALYESKHQIVLTSDRPPKEIQTLEDRLRTRFEWGLLADIQPPDFETRLAIIHRKAELLGITLPDEVNEYIANRLKNNIRQLEGAVKKIKAYNLLTGDSPSIAIAQNAIRDILNDNQPPHITVDHIIEEVSRTFGVAIEDIKGKMRSGNTSIARQVSMYIIREITQMSTSSIGEKFNGRDHSTVVYAIQKVEEDMKHKPHLKATIEDIIKNIRAN